MKNRIVLLLMISSILTGLQVKGRTDDKVSKSSAESMAKDAVWMGESADGVATESVKIVMPEYRWRLSAGMLLRRFDRISFRSGMRSSAVAIPRRFPRDLSVNYNIPGPGDGHANHAYDNGFVNLDPGTASDGDTWNWGYTDASQVSGNSIWFQSDLGIEQSTRMESLSRTGGEWHEDHIDVPALFIEAARCFQQVAGVTLGVVCNVMYSEIDINDTHSNFSATQHFSQDSVSISDRYDLLGMIPPAAPYSGTYDGPGPLLGNVPAEQVVSHTLLNNQTATYVNQVHEDLDVELLTIGVGLSAAREVDRMAFSGVAGLALNVVKTKATYDERLIGSQNDVTFSVAEWHESETETEFLMGLFGQVSLSIAFTERLHLGVIGRYDWMETIAGSVGPSEYEITLKGFSGGVMLGWAF